MVGLREWAVPLPLALEWLGLLLLDGQLHLSSSDSRSYLLLLRHLKRKFNPLLLSK